MVAINAIRELANRIAREFSPDRIVLFGSHSSGNVSPDSDVDLLIVIAHEGKSWEKAAEIRGRVRPQFPVDLLVRSPSKLQERLALGDAFLQSVLESGQVLYEAHHG